MNFIFILDHFYFILLHLSLFGRVIARWDKFITLNWISLVVEHFNLQRLEASLLKRYFEMEVFMHNFFIQVGKNKRLV